MLSTQSFIVLALSAATAAAQQCSYTPPPPSTSNGSSSDLADVADQIFPPNDSTPDDVTVSITDSLCFDPQLAGETTWSDVQGIIDGHNEKIEQLRQDKQTAIDCEARELEVWKKRYPFECPATTPTFENYKLFLPTANQDDLQNQAAAKTASAALLTTDAGKHTARLALIPGEQAAQTQNRLDAQGQLELFTKFQAYWNANGGTFDLVDVKFKADKQAAIDAVAVANAAFGPVKSSYDALVINQGVLAASVQKVTQDLASAEALFLQTFEVEITNLQGPLDLAVSQAQSAYDLALQTAKDLVKAKEDLVKAAQDALDIDGLEQIYKNAQNAVTAAADLSLSAQESVVASAKKDLDDVKALLLAAQQTSATVVSLQTCYDATNALFQTALTTGVDKNLYETRTGDVDEKLQAAKTAQLEIAVLQLSVNSAQQAYDTQNALLPALRLAVSQAQAQIATTLAVTTAKSNWDIARNSLNTAQTVKDANAELVSARNALNNPTATDPLGGPLADLTLKQNELAIDTALAKARQDLATAKANIKTQMTNYADLQQAITDAQSLLNIENGLVSAALPEYNRLKNALEAAGKLAFDADIEAYYDKVLLRQETYDANYKAFAGQVSTNLSSYLLGFQVDTDAFMTTVIPTFDLWINNVAAAAGQSTVPDASGVSPAQATFNLAKQPLIDALILMDPQDVYQAITWLDGVATKASQYIQAQYAGPDADGNYEMTKTPGALSTTITAGMKLEYEKYVLDATVTYSAWPTIKAEFVKVLAEVIAKGDEQAEAALKVLTDQQVQNKANDLSTKKTDQETADRNLNGFVGSPVPQVSTNFPATVCSAGEVEICSRTLDSSSQILADCEALATQPTPPSGTVTDPIVGLKAQRDDAFARLNAAKALEVQYVDMFDYRTAQTNKQKSLQAQMELIDQSITAQLTTINNAAPSDLTQCNACNPCPADDGVDSTTIKSAKTQATALQIQKRQKQAEIDDLQNNIVYLSDTNQAQSEKERNAEEVVDTQKEYDDLLDDVKTAVTTLEIANQWVAANENPTQLTLLQSQQRTRLTPLIAAAKAECTAKKTIWEGYKTQIADIESRANDLDLRKTQLETDRTNLNNAGCKASIFLTERIKEFDAEIKVLHDEYAFIRLPLNNPDSTDLLQVDTGLNELAKAAEAAKKVPCELVVELEDEYKDVVDTVKAWKQETFVKDCQNWCAISNWSLYRPTIPSVSSCKPTSFTALKTEMDKVLASPYNFTLLGNFASCNAGFQTPSQSFGDDWTSFNLDYAQKVQDATCEFNRLASELTWIGTKPETLTAQAKKLTDDAAALTQRYADEVTNNTKMTDAKAIQACDTISNNGLDDEIRNYQAKIADQIVIRSTKYKSYWEGFQTEQEDLKKQLIADLKAAKDNLEPLDDTGAANSAYQAVFPIFALADATSTQVVRRMLRRDLAELQRQDLQMIQQIAGTDKPEKIKICISDTVDVTLNVEPIQGFQVYYGTGTNELAGPAHGDVSSGCTDSQFPANERPTGISFYTAAEATQPLLGLKISFPTATNNISGGIVDVSTTFAAEKTFVAGEDLQFFGFDTTFDDSTKTFTVFSVASYDIVEFAKIKNVILTTDAQIIAAEDNIQAAIQGQQEWDQIAKYQKVIEADVLTGIAKVVPGPVYVLRKEEAEKIQEDIDAQVVAIKAEQAAAVDAGVKAKEDYSNRVTLVQKELQAKVAAGDENALDNYQGHVNEDEGANTGGIVAAIFGGLILIALTVFLMCKAIRMQRFNEMCKMRAKMNSTPGQGNRILVNQSARSDDQKVAADDI